MSKMSYHSDRHNCHWCKIEEPLLTAFFFFCGPPDCTPRAQEEENPCDNKVNCWCFIASKYNHQQQKNSEPDIEQGSPFAFGEFFLIPVDGTIDNEEHRRNCKQHPK